MSPVEVSPGCSRFASLLAETARLCGTVVTWLAGTVKVGPSVFTWQQMNCGFDGSLVAESAAVRITTCIVPGLAIAGSVTEVIVPVPPPTGSGAKSLPTPALLHHQVQVGARQLATVSAPAFS